MIENNDRLNLFKRDWKMAYSAKAEVQNRIDESVAMYTAVRKEERRTSGHTVAMRDIKRAVEGLVPKLVEPFVSTEKTIMAEPTELGSERGAKLQELLLNEEIDRVGRYSFFEDISRRLIVEGTVWLRAGWRDGMAHAYVCENDAVFPDPSARSVDEARFVIYRRKVSKKDIADNEDWFGKGSGSKVSGLSGTTFDEDASGTMDNEYYNHGRDSSFNFSPGDEREIVTVYEYYGYDDSGEPVLFIWSGDVVLRDEESPFGDRPVPFVCTQYMKTPGAMWGDGLPMLIADYQNVRSGIVNGVLDNMSVANNGQVFIRKGALDYVNYKRMRNGERIIQVNQLPREAMEHASYNQLPPSIFNLLEMFQIEEENVTGVTRFNQGNDPRALNSTATGIVSLSNMAEQRTLHTTRQISALVEGLCSLWMRFNKMFLADVFRVRSDEGMLVPFMKDELNLDARIRVVVGTAGMNEKRLNDAIMLLNLSREGAIPLDDESRKELAAVIAESTGFYTVARKIRSGALQSSQQGDGGGGSGGSAAEALKMASEIELNRAKAARETASAAKAVIDAESSAIRARADMLDTLVVK